MARATVLAHELAALSDGPAARRVLCEGAIRVTVAQDSVICEPTAAENRLRATASAGRWPATDVLAREASSGAIQAALTARPSVESHQPAAPPRPTGASRARSPRLPHRRGLIEAVDVLLPDVGVELNCRVRPSATSSCRQRSALAV